MQPQRVDIVSTPHSPPAPERLPQLERRVSRRGDVAAGLDDAAGEAFDIPVLDDGSSAAVTVRYALDQIARTWVAHVFDAETGDLLKEVPSTEYHHQMALLASIRRRSVDARA